MNLNPIKANMTELDLCDGTKVLFSYRTEHKWSKTTTRHINAWLSGYDFTKPQDFFDGLVAGVK